MFNLEFEDSLVKRIVSMIRLTEPGYELEVRINTYINNNLFHGIPEGMYKALKRRLDFQAPQTEYKVTQVHSKRVKFDDFRMIKQDDGSKYFEHKQKGEITPLDFDIITSFSKSSYQKSSYQYHLIKFIFSISSSQKKTYYQNPSYEYHILKNHILKIVFSEVIFS